MNNKALIRNKLRSEWKSLVVGLVLTIIGLMFLCWGITDGWNDFRLIQMGMTTSGSITATWEEPRETDAGGGWSHGASYTYSLPDGRQFHGTTIGSGRLKEEFRYLSISFPIQVEYLPNEPAVSRIKGEGPTSLLDVFRHEFMYGLLGIAFLTMGFYGLWLTIRGNKKDSRPP